MPRAMTFCSVSVLVFLLGAGEVLARPPQEATNAPADASGPREKAWGILREGLNDENADKRAKAVRALGLITGNVEAEKAALRALQDKKPNVRMAAASALGSMQAKHANVELEGALQDSEPAVVLAAANSLLLLHDDVGYDIYYDVDRGKAREQGTDQRRTQHIQRQKEIGGIWARGRHRVYPIRGNGVRGVQNGDERRFFAGTGWSGKTTGARSEPGYRKSAGKSNHGQELGGSSSCTGGNLAAGRSLAGFRGYDGFG